MGPLDSNASVQQTLHLSKYEVWVSLGCSLEEQKNIQPVHFDIEIYFNMTVKGAYTDSIDEAVDYVLLTQEIKKISESQSFNLIENLTYLVHQKLLKILNQKGYQGQLKVTGKKLRPPVQNLQGGVSFSCQSSF